MEFQKKTIEPAIPRKRSSDDANHRELNAFRKRITMVSKYPPPKLRTGVQVTRNFPSGCGIPQNSIRNQENLKLLKSLNDGLSVDFKYFLDNKIKSFKDPESCRNAPFGSRPEGKVKFWVPTGLQKGSHARKPKVTTTAVTHRIPLKKLDNIESNHGKMTSHGKEKVVGFQPMENIFSSELTMAFQKKTTEVALTRQEPINKSNQCESEEFRKSTEVISTNPLPNFKTGVQVVRDFSSGCGIPQDSFRSNAHLKPFTSSNNGMLVDDLKYFVDNKIKSFNSPESRRNNPNDSRPSVSQLKMEMLKKKSENVIPKKRQLDDSEIQKRRRLGDVYDRFSREVEKFAKPRTMFCQYPPPKIRTGVRILHDYPSGCGMVENSVGINAEKKGLKNTKSVLEKLKQKELERWKAFGLRPEGKVKFWDPTCSKEGDMQEAIVKTSVVMDRKPLKSLENADLKHGNSKHEKIKEAMIIFEEFNERLYEENRLRPKEEKVAHWRVPLEAAKLVQKKLKWMDCGNILGSVLGVQIGDTFQYRAQPRMIGLHCQPLSGIDYTMIRGKNLALSIVDAHRYSNEKGSSDMLTYCGQGGLTFLGGKAPPEDQKLERNSKDEKTPVRVIRKVHGNGRSNEVFVYDGLYSVIDFSQKRVAQTTTNDAGTSTTLIPAPVTTDEKAQKKNDVKARSMLLMALPNEHLMTFNQYKDAKSLFAAIQIRFGVWRNKPNIDIMSFDDLYNNFKIVEQEVKGTASSSLNSQNMAFVSSPNSTNGVNTTYGVSTANTQANPTSTQVNTTSTQVSTTNLSDATVYAFLASQPNGSQLAHEELVQIHEDDLEEMDLKWQLALLSMTTRRFFQKTGRKITIIGNDTAVYDKSKVECLTVTSWDILQGSTNNQGTKIAWNQDSSRRTVNVEDTSSNAMVAIDGASFDWSFRTDDEVPTNMALMAFQTLSKNGLGYEGYHVVSPPSTGLFSPLKLDLSNSRLEKFKQPEFERYEPKSCEIESTNASAYIPDELKEYPNASLIKDRVSDNKDCSVKSPVVVEKKNVVPTIAKVEFIRTKQQEKPIMKTVRDVEMYMSQANCNYHQRERMVSRNNYSKSHPQKEDQGYVDSGCFRHMTGNMSYLSDFKEFDEGYVTFGRGSKGGRITGKGTLKIDKLDFEDVYFVKELKFNLLSVSHMCDKKNSVLFTGTICFVLSPDFRLIDESRVLLKVPRRNNRRVGHINFKNINKMVKDNLVRGLPLKRFENDQTCIACLKGKQHKALYHLGKFDGKSDDGFFVGYSLNNKAFMVYNLRTRKVEENLHIRFLEDKPSITSNGPKWLFDIDVLTKSINYVSVVADGSLFDSSSKNVNNDEPQPFSDAGHKDDEGVSKESEIDNQEKPGNSTQDVNTARSSINTANTNVNTKVDLSNSSNTYLVPFTPNTRIHKDHSLDHVIGDVQSDLPYGKRAIGTKWIYRNKKDERGIVVRNKDKLVTHGYTQEEGIDYDEVFSPVAKIEAIRLFLAYSSFKDFIVYQMDVKSAFLKELCTEFEKLMNKKFQMSYMGELSFFLGLQVTQKNDGIFISRDKYVDEIFKKFGFSTVKTACTPMEISKPLLKDAEAKDVDVYLYRSMIGSLMYLIASRPDMMFGVYALISWQCKKIVVANSTTEAEYVAVATAKVKTVNEEEQIQALVDKKKVIITETSIRSDLHLEDAEDMGEDSEIPTNSHHTPTVTQPSTSSQPQQKNKSKKSKKRITEDRLKLTELIELCTQLQSRVLTLETTKDNQPLEIGSLKRRVKKLEKKASKKTHKLKRLYKTGRMIADLDADEGVALVDETQGRNDQDMFDIITTAGVEVSITTAGEVVTTAGVETSKPKAKGIVMQEPSEIPTPTPIYSSQQSSKAKDNGKAKIIKPKKPLKRKDQIMINEEVARNLEAQMQLN
uniref:Putative SRA-YDG, PUA-like domain protein n=1 Tax=Tanacetum cinerariifolium TaxID=118510 RepID=A0A6L2KMP1_TANCI|nr:putative SRA-YDG, PUA-like domain protein [Tanacetum cinerariifolium]